MKCWSFQSSKNKSISELTTFAAIPRNFKINLSSFSDRNYISFIILFSYMNAVLFSRSSQISPLDVHEYLL